jgi:hypothetical protein
MGYKLPQKTNQDNFLKSAQKFIATHKKGGSIFMMQDTKVATTKDLSIQTIAQFIKVMTQWSLWAIPYVGVEESAKKAVFVDMVMQALDYLEKECEVEQEPTVH